MKPFRILIVDDQGDTRRGLRACLETLSDKPDILDVPSGEEAILVNSHQSFDLLVVDVRLPGMSGLELIQQAQIRNPNLKIILITGLTDPLVREQIANANADAYFFKPFEMNAFLGIVQRYIKASHEHTVQSQGDLAHLHGHLTAGISERLTKLRTELQAECALLISETSEILAQTWVLPAKLSTEDLVRSTMSLMHAVVSVSTVVGSPTPNDLTVISSNSYDYALTHVGQAVGLLVIGSAGSFSKKYADSISGIMLSAASDLFSVLSKIDGKNQFAASETNPLRADASAHLENKTPHQEMEMIFETKKKVEDSKASSFWETAADDDYINKELRPDAITYDQARELGLTPGEE